MEGNIISAEKCVESVSGLYTMLIEMVANNKVFKNEGELYIK